MNPVHGKTQTPTLPPGVQATSPQPSPAKDTIEKAPLEPVVINPVSIPTIEISKDPTVPLFDFSQIAASKGTERFGLIAEFGNALIEVGFVGLKIPDELKDLIAAVNIEMKRYYHQGIETKMKDWHDDGGQTGFSQYGREAAAGSKGIDIKETYFVPPNYSDWPEDQPSFEAAMKPYHENLTEIAGEVMAWFLEFVDEPTDSIRADVASATGNLLRLAHYFAPKDNDDPQAVWAAAHEDLNALTLLPPSTPGLQLLTKDGKWKNVVVPEGYIIVNTGEQVEQLTNGLIKATRHQVVNPGGVWGRRERFASIFFASFPDDKDLTPLPSCVEAAEDETKQYPSNITVAEARLSRLIEMGSVDPDFETAQGLLNMGLLQKPTEALKLKFQNLF